MIISNRSINVSNIRVGKQGTGVAHHFLLARL